MRPLRAPLTVVLAIAVLFDIREAFRVYQFGWPPNDLGYADEPGVIPISTPETRSRTV